MTNNKQIVLDSRPTDKVRPANFRLVEAPLPTPGPGEVLVRHHYLSLDPYMRGRLSDARSYAKPQELGAVMGGGRSARSSPRTIRGFKPAISSSAWAAGGSTAVSDGRDLTRRRRQDDSPASLSRPGRHARRHRLVRPQQDHRAEEGRDGRRLRRHRRGRLGRRAAREDRGRARRRRRRRRRRNAPMRSTNSASTPASITSRRVSPRR